MLKRLENVEIDEDERHEIAEYIARKFSVDDSVYIHHIMTKDKTIYDFDTYEILLKSNKISPDDAFVYVEDYNSDAHYPAYYLYPFLVGEFLLPNAYLSKLGFRPDYYYVAPATGLKYIAIVNEFRDFGRMVVEVADIDTVVISTNLQTLVQGVLSTKHSIECMTYKDAAEIMSRFLSQKLFAGYNFSMAEKIIRRYYEDNDTSSAKDVEAIKDAYNHIFQPYRVVYDLNTKQFVVSGNNESR